MSKIIGGFQSYDSESYSRTQLQKIQEIAQQTVGTLTASRLTISSGIEGGQSLVQPNKHHEEHIAIFSRINEHIGLLQSGRKLRSPGTRRTWLSCENVVLVLLALILLLAIGFVIQVLILLVRVF